MDNNFNFKDKEKQIYSRWLEKKYFHAEVKKNEPHFSIVMPPPNITSKLHMGHAFQETIQDIIIRRKRMEGFNTLWLPGTDHAAIATEAKVVEKLRKEGKTKEEIGRDNFKKEIEDWYKTYKGTIIEQFKHMGFSCDWDRLAFTMDEKCSYAVRKAFYTLYHKGLIYRGNRMVNWCPNCKSSISDAEVEYQENMGHLWHIRYQIEGTEDYIEVATTRPETLLGDTAVAVNPKDERYTHLVGKNVVLPLANRLIPIVADEYVDMEFGTGVVKITPAHDINDLEVGKRHNLPVICIMNEDGTINENGGKYVGLDRFVAREKMVEDLKASGNLVSIEDYKNNVGHCERCKHVVEPLISKQWFVKMEELAKPAIQAVKNGDVEFVPDRFKKIYLNWLENIRDWCISRQLWSGHRIPVFTCEDCGEEIVEMENPTVCPKCGSTHLIQDADTLDTWFSSALWPLSTLGWPEKTPELEYFYPTDVLVTAQEIIQLWVVRMVFSGLEYVKDIPFRKVVINGTVKDALGRKMSKNLGNGVDPIEIIDKYGTDALRFSLFNGVSIDMDTRFSEKKVQLASAFINKIWNASKFAMMQFEKVEEFNIDFEKLTLADKWFYEKLCELNKSVSEKFNKYDIGMVASELYDFFWGVYCDYFIEIVKVEAQDESLKNNSISLLRLGLDVLLKLLHPYIPFVTEELYLNLPLHKESIVIAEAPKLENKNFGDDAEKFEEIIAFIKSIRNLRKEKGFLDNQKTALIISDYDANIVLNEAIIKKLALLSEIEFKNAEDDNRIIASVPNNLCKAYLVIGEKNNEEEKARLEELKKQYESELNRANRMLSNQGFVAKAPEKLIDAEKEKIKKYEKLIEEVALEISKID